MDNSVHNPIPPEELARLETLQAELEGQELTVLLKRLQERCELSVNQMAVAAGMDESALHKILKGDSREFKASHVDALLDDLEHQGKLVNDGEITIWKRALRVSAFLHYNLYKAIEPRLRQMEDVVERIEALKIYLKEQYPALAETYDKTGGVFPVFVPLVDVAARVLDKKWGWIRIPPGYEALHVTSKTYSLLSTDVFPKPLKGLGSDLEILDQGFGVYKVKRRVLTPNLVMPKVSDNDQIDSRMTVFAGIEFMPIPAGKFIMGSSDDDKHANDVEKPQHTVDIPYDYWIGHYPITNKQFNKAEFTDFVMSRFGQTSVFKMQEKPYHPVVNISWHDALDFVKILNQTYQKNLPEGYVFRLPSEAEWEKAARGTRGNIYPWGDEWHTGRCNSVDFVFDGTSPVGQFSPSGDSPYGVADMSGNVWEWTRSIIKEYPYKADDGREGEEENSSRVLRGGAFNYSADHVRCAVRGWYDPHFEIDRVGFRVVISPVLPSS